MSVKQYRVKPGTKVKLDACSPEDSSAFPGKKSKAAKKLAQLVTRLRSLQELLFAQREHKVLMVLQAMDTGGKDGTIKSVFRGTDPQGLRIANFVSPTAEELAHDYLWRVHKQVPKKGELVIFNRSHYEDVLIVRVHNLVPRKVWMRRFGHIVDFERMLVDEGTTILKLFLNISMDEQKKRLQRRLDNPNKHWKFSRQDIAERKLWPRYIKAYEDVISRTSTKHAPWYIIPANRKWYRNLVVGQVLVDTLENLGMSFPPPEEGLSEIVIE